MANFIGYGRSNYVTPKDTQAFKTVCAKYDVELIQNSEGQIGYICMSEDGDATRPKDNCEDEYLSLFDELLPLLADGEVLIQQCIGYEKMRYLSGWGMAGNNKGKVKSINMQSLLMDQAKKLTKRKSGITEPEY